MSEPWEDALDAIKAGNAAELWLPLDVHLATLRTTITTLEAKAAVLWDKLEWAEVTIGALQMMVCPLAMSDEVCAAFKVLHPPSIREEDSCSK